MLRRLTLFIAYRIAPLTVFVVIVFSERFRIAGLVAFAMLFLFFLIRGKDYRGNPTVMGIRRDSSFLGRSQPAKRDEKDSPL